MIYQDRDLTPFVSETEEAPSEAPEEEKEEGAEEESVE